VLPQPPHLGQGSHDTEDQGREASIQLDLTDMASCPAVPVKRECRQGRGGERGGSMNKSGRVACQEHADDFTGFDTKQNRACT